MFRLGIKKGREKINEDFTDLFPSLRKATEEYKLDASYLMLTLSMPQDSVKNPFIEDRHQIYLADKHHQFGKWSIFSLTELFRGTQTPPEDMERYPEKYVQDFHLIEFNVLLAHDFLDYEVTDDEFVRIYSLMKRRPEARGEGFLHDVVYQSAALMLGLKPRSQREFEAIFARLVLSARHWREGYASRNYIGYLKRSYSGLLEKKDPGQERLLERVRSGNSPLKDAIIVDIPPHMKKMSEVILDFAEPLLKDAQDTASAKMNARLRKNIIIFSIFVWNASLLSERKREIAKKKIIVGLAPPRDVENFETMAVRWFDKLIERKEKYFSCDKRAVADFEFSGSGGALRLNVLFLIPSEDVEKLAVKEASDLWNQKV